MLGSGTDTWKYWAELRAGNITEQDWNEIEDGIARSAGTCMTMGTASTMTAIAEALGLTLPGASSIPAADAAPPAHGDGLRAAHRRDGLGRPEAVRHPRPPRRSSNALVVAHRARRLDQRHRPPGRHGAAGRRAARRSTDFDELARETPVLANIRPSGAYLMEDFFYRRRPPGAAGAAGAIPAPRRPTVNGRHARREHRRRRGLQRRRDPAARQARRGLGQHRRPARQSRARRRGDQAARRRASAAPSTPARPSCSTIYDDMAAADRRSRPRRRRRITSWCCATPARSARPACRNGASCRSRRSCCSRACATCCGSPTRA